MAGLACSMKDLANKKAITGFNNFDFYDEFRDYLSNSQHNDWYMFVANPKSFQMRCAGFEIQQPQARFENDQIVF